MWQVTGGEMSYISGVIDNCSRTETPADYHTLRVRVAQEAKVDPGKLIVTTLNPL
jgi:hypothetical protein